jgi:GDP-L-fucose synthase
MIRKFHEGKIYNSHEVVIWGSGTPLREFMYVDDLADACIFLMQEYDKKLFVNIGTGEEVTIADLAGLIKEVTGFAGNIVFDKTKPDGTPRKLMDSSRLHAFGWQPKITLHEGLKLAYQHFLVEQAAKEPV